MWIRVVLALATVVLVATGLTAAAPREPAASGVPRFDHIVLVMFENRAYAQIRGAADAPYLNALADQGATFTRSYAITHPSQPNYIALFSGSTQGVTSNDCPQRFTGPNLHAQLAGAGLTFTGYSESMPADGYTGCVSGTYQRKHNSWANFSSVTATSNRTFASFPSPADFASLPTVAFVTPDMCNDMHDCPVGTGDSWLRTNLDAYARWAKTHNSLLIVTFDEDNHLAVNQIFTVFAGARVEPGSYPGKINHYSVLRTIEAAYGLPGLNAAANLSPITDIWT
ncbi:alkaline phosphatase family protein [Dactylosporangium sp. NPDC051541]|uniref:alkaline phosphatase family protein n=1 Tax=Dactylosporangium sp. NPDC051541 TaxID=3363977 RepID=UPI00379EF5B9